MHLFGAHYNYPELNCYNCGKDTKSSTFLSEVPRTEPGTCTHLPENNLSKVIVDFCKAKTTASSCENTVISGDSVFVVKYLESSCGGGYNYRVNTSGT